MTEQREKLLSLHRYYIWANRMRVHFLDLLSSGDISSSQGKIESRLYLSYWYGGLYVVVEGWKELDIVDEPIDRLLDSPNVGLLRRFRNGVFHFQKKYNDARFFDLIKEREDVVQWVHALNAQFGRYLLEALHSAKDELS